MLPKLTCTLVLPFERRKPTSMPASSPPSSPRIVFTSAGRSWRKLAADLLYVPRGLSHVPGGETHSVGVHFGPPVNADCRCGSRRMRRVQMHGDIDVVPAGVDGSWEDDADCHILWLCFHPTLLQQVGEELGRPAGKLELVPRLQLRDPRIEAIGWAVKSDLESESPSDPLYIDSLTNALVVRLIETASGSSQPPEAAGRSRLSARQLRRLTDFIERNLDQKLHLAHLATVAGVSVTRLKTLFRNRTGVPVHQYVLRRRVEYARALLASTATPASEVAVMTGFSHQSHMASTMRRLLGHAPSDVSRQAHEI